MSYLFHGRPKLGFFISLVVSMIFFHFNLCAQTTAGNAVFQFLESSYSAKATSLGGINISQKNDLGLAMYNPSLLEESMDDQFQVSVKPYFASINQYNLSGARWWERKHWILGWGVHYLDYGTIPMTDAVGNEIGTYTPKDYALQLSLSTQYFQNFRIGSTMKYIHSNYGSYQSSGIAIDVGLHYTSASELSSASILVRNMGLQTKGYLKKEELPFNIILGWSKKLEKAPLEFSITAERLSVWNNLYYDSTFSNQEGFAKPNNIKNILNHLVVGGTIYIGEQVDLNVGYNFIRRNDLNLENQQNWLNGFSTGFGFALNRMKVQYASAFFQRNTHHHFTVQYAFKR